MLIFEDVAYRELAWGGDAPPTLWSLAPDVVVQAGTFSKSFFPGVRLGWAVGPADVVAELVAAKRNTDQCAGGLGQRLLEEYGRAGGFERHLPAARELYASHWAALVGALARAHARGRAWTEPAGGFLTWMTLPDGLDSTALRADAIAAGVAYVPGAPFFVDDGGARHAAAVVQPPGRARPRDRRRAPRRRRQRRAHACAGVAAARPGYRY